MSFNIPEAHVRMYSDMLINNVQQFESKVRPLVTIESVPAEGKRFDLLATSDAETDTPRHSDAMVASPIHEGRWLSPRDIHWGSIIDTEDKARMLADPQGPYLRAGSAAVARQIDKFIIDSLTATVVTGKNLGGTASFPSSQEIAVDYVEAGTANDADRLLTIAKLRRARFILDNADVDLDNEPAFWLTTAKGMQDLLATTEVTSADFNTVRALVQGEIDTFMGFKFIRINGSIGGVKLMPTDTSTDITDNFAFVRSGVKWGEAISLNVSVAPRHDKKGTPMGLQVNASGNGLRFEDEKVVRIKVDNSP